MSDRSTRSMASAGEIPDRRCTARKQRGLVNRLEAIVTRSSANKSASGRFKVYVLQVHPRKVAESPFELYVGSTAKPADVRLAEHQGRVPGGRSRMFKNGTYEAVSLREDWMYGLPSFARRKDAERAEAVTANYLSELGYRVYSDKLDAMMASGTRRKRSYGVEEVVDSDPSVRMLRGEWEITYFLDATDVTHMQARGKRSHTAACGVTVSGIWWSDSWQPDNYVMCRTCDDLHPYVGLPDGLIHVRSLDAGWISKCGRVLTQVEWQGDGPLEGKPRCIDCTLRPQLWTGVPGSQLAFEQQLRDMPADGPRVRIVRGGAPGLGRR